MRRNRIALGAALAATLGFLTAFPAKAASLQSVSNWSGGVSGLPSDVSMYIYVPDKVATNPPILTLIHYCGGTASSVFGQAQGGGVVKAADQYGFIIVAPSSGRCWDIVSTKTRTRDGGGDSHAIKQMVVYAIDKYKANADRVYATGDSSGGMTTELLLALYPDIFKAGSAFAGMPAGCGNATSSPGSYDGSCAGGSVTHTAEQWGDIARKMDPGYTGHRGRVQLFHGDADGTINYKNHTEAIKEWTNLLGLGTDPTSTDSVTLGSHKATRQKWTNACGYLVLEAYTSIGGDHGPSDALFNSTYVVPFLGLDKTGATDPEIAQCGGGGAQGSDAGVGGAGGASGAGGAGGQSASKDAGLAGGNVGTGGHFGASGGQAGTGGALGTAGKSAGAGGAQRGSGGSQVPGGNGAGGKADGGGGASSAGGGGKRADVGTNGSAGKSAEQGSGGGKSTLGSAGSATGENGAADDLRSGASSCAIRAIQGSRGGEIEILALGLAFAASAQRRRRAAPRAKCSGSSTDHSPGAERR